MTEKDQQNNNSHINFGNPFPIGTVEYDRFQRSVGECSDELTFLAQRGCLTPEQVKRVYLEIQGVAIGESIAIEYSSRINASLDRDDFGERD